MHIKRFEAATMEAALAAVKAELGPDALILSSRTFRKGRQSFGLMAKKMVEVQAACERGSAKRDIGPQPASESLSSDPLAEGSRGAGAAEASASLRQVLAKLQDREDFEEEVRSELRGFRRAMQGVLGASIREAADPRTQSLARAGLDWVHAESLVREWREHDAPEEAGSLEDVLCRRLESRLAAPRADDGSRVRVLVGAPGVGKTTTLAKLAARNDEGERDVALIALDHYRIGATDQLRHYASLLNSPFVEVRSASDLRSEVERFRGCAVMVDTAGRGPRAIPELDALSMLRNALGEEASIELVMDATARRDVQQSQLARFAPLSPDKIIFAKTDECESLADVANLVLDPTCPPLCWLGTGQRVPQDLALVEARVLARDVMGLAA